MIEYILDLFTLAAVFTVFVLGLNLQFGITGLINFGHVAFLAIGSYGMAILMLKYAWPLIPALLAGVALASLFSLIIGFASLRLRQDYLAIVTIGFSEIVRTFITNEAWLTRGPQGLHGFATPMEWFTRDPFGQRIVLFLLAVLVAAVIFAVINRATHTPWGRVLKGIREDEDAAIALGKNTRTFKIQALAIGSAIAGLAGALWAFYLKYLNPRQFLPLLTFEGWMIMVLGGAGNNWGVALGALLYHGLYRITRPLEQSGIGGLTGHQVAALRVMVVGLVLVLLMMFRPQGLLGRKEELSLDR